MTTQSKLKISIITAALNNKDTIEDCILSILNQDYPAIEHIIIDGGSSDDTLNIIKQYEDRISKIISEPDNGMYEALDKGIMMATGDIIGILNSDDYYSTNTVISDVIEEFERTNVDSVFADLIFIKKNDHQKVVRYYRSSNFNINKFAYGWMPAHPTFFTKRTIYEKYGVFKTDYSIAADFELLVRFLATYRISYSYIPKVIVKMRMGGLSTKNLKSNWILNKEIVRACSENGIKTNMLKVCLKYFTKIVQLIHTPK